jgi:hypothetical protein
VSAHSRHPVLAVSLTGLVIRCLRSGRASLKNDSRQRPGSIARTSVRLERYGVNVGIATMHALLCAIGVSWAEFRAALDAELSAQLTLWSRAQARRFVRARWGDQGVSSFALLMASNVLRVAETAWS